MALSDKIDAFAAADGPPPNTLWSFFGWGLSGAGPMIWLAAALSIAVGLSEVLAFFIVGWLIDFFTGE